MLTTVAIIHKINVFLSLQIRYSLLEISDKFSINSSTGEVRTKQMLDREKIGSYVVNVRATDMGTSQLSTDGKV